VAVYDTCIELEPTERRLIQSDLWRFVSRRAVSNRVARLIAPSSQARVLEVGCGAGFNVSEQFRRNPSWWVTALDLDREMVERTRATLRTNLQQVATVQGNALALPFHDDTFDLVMCLGILHHVGDWRLGLRELRRVTRSGGQVIVADLLDRFFAGPVRKWYPPVETYSLSDLEAALPRAGLAPVTVKAGRLGYLIACRPMARVPDALHEEEVRTTLVRLTRRPPAAPRALPGARLAQYRRNPARFLETLHRERGDVVSFRLAWYRVYLVSDPSVIKQVLVTTATKFHKGLGGQEARRLLGNGVITSEGDYHHRQRKLMRPLLDTRRVSAFAPEIVSLTDSMLSGWANRAEVDVSRSMSELTVQIIGRIALNADVRTATGLIAQTMSLASEAFTRLTTPWGRLLEPLPLRDARDFRKSRASLYAYVDELIARRRASLDGESDLLSVLVAATDDSGRALTDLQIRDEVVTMVLAGHETTAQLLAWALYLLSVNPEIEQHLHEELDQQLGGREPALADLGRLKYSTHIVYETLRLYPPVYAIGRRVIEDLKLSGWSVRQGDLVVVSPWIVHRDPRWFEQPDRFLPERWEEPGLGSGFRFLPFGGGERSCLGQPLVSIEAPLVLARVAQRFALRYPSDAPAPEIEPRVSLRPKSPIRLVPRSREQ
jgi:cytochrome P450/ubiquinone/menaquinone biosynthesis C-methylase UbiE